MRRDPRETAAPRIPPGKLWAEPEGLVTTRRAIDREVRKAQDIERQIYLQAADPGEDFLGTV